MILNYLKLLRIHQYVKNFFIFLPLFFAIKFTEISLLIQTTYAFVSFSLVASSIYILNDIRDIEEDRNHPRKSKRPLASGTIGINHAAVVMALCLALGMSIAFFHNIRFMLILSGYFVMNILYSYRLKHIAPLDIFIIATGFLLRLLSGTDYAGITAVHPSHWIIIMTFLLALFLAFAKRRDDVILYLKGHPTRKNIDGYSLEFINSAMSIMVSVIIVGYILYTINPSVAHHFKSENLYLTVIFVLLGMFRYLQLTFVYNRSGSPTEILLKDRFLQLTIAGWLLSFVYFAY